jgi:hypothetical protein
MQSPHKSVIGVLCLLLLSSIFVTSAKAQSTFTAYTDKAAFQAALDDETVVDFDGLSGRLTGNEFAPVFTIAELGGGPLNILDAAALPPGYSNPGLIVGSQSLSSSYANAGDAVAIGEGYVASPDGSILFKDPNSDNVEFTFSSGQRAAGIYIGENDSNAVGVLIKDVDGNTIVSQTFPATAENRNVFFGIVVTSGTPIGSIQVVEAANDNDGITIDCLIYSPAAGGGEEDDDPPVVTVAAPFCLGPPFNHKYKTITPADFITSISDEDPEVDIDDVIITSVTSDEFENSGGDGNTLNDIVIADDCKSVDLRVERDGGSDGRVYTIHFSVSDSNGNTTTGTAQILVSHDNRACRAVDSGVHYTVSSACAN